MTDWWQRVASVGLCECGCGKQTKVSPANYPPHGYVKGMPRRFVMNHDKRKSAVAEYRRGDNGTRVHRIRAEKALGRPLPNGAVVHHADGSKADDAPLVICQDQAYHRFLHARMRVKAAGGNPNTDAVCPRCQQAKPRAHFRPHAGSTFGVRMCLDCKPYERGPRG